MTPVSNLIIEFTEMHGPADILGLQRLRIFLYNAAHLLCVCSLKGTMSVRAHGATVIL